jgi:hypothetical protein
MRRKVIWLTKAFSTQRSAKQNQQQAASLQPQACSKGFNLLLAARSLSLAAGFVLAEC